MLLPADPRIFSSRALKSVRAGKFDRRDVRNLPGYLGDARRLLDFRGGAGVAAMYALREIPDLTVMLHDERPGIADAARLIASRNGIDDPARLKIVGGPLQPSSDQDGQLTGLAACLSEFRPDALRLSGAEHLEPEALIAMPLDSVRRVIVTGAPGKDPSAVFGDALTRAGFKEEVERSTDGSLLFLRG